MSFDTAWLDLREPADHAARDADLLNSFAQRLPPSPKIIDLGSGTGSTMRAVSSVRPDADWLLTDNDSALLTEAKRRAPHVSTLEVDLAGDLAKALADEADAITASALIDLVSATWLDELVQLARGRVIYVALSYNGHEDWSPNHPHDDEIFAAFQAHQRGDKGFGPSLGPDAVAYFEKALKAAGYVVEIAPSPWVLQSSPLMNALASGVAGAAIEAGVDTKNAEEWLQARRDSTSCSVGHVDLLAISSKNQKYT